MNNSLVLFNSILYRQLKVMGNRPTIHSNTTNSNILPSDPSPNEPQNDLRVNRNKKLVMDRLRRSLRESFRRKKEHIPESSKPHQWQADEQAVKAGTCVFPVKYLGCVEVFESRGMQVCEEALKVLRSSRRRATKGTLFVTGDGLRVVDDETKGLIVDQTIEKVSFCAPDRSHERGFSYICRDGTTRRWMCHGFNACKDSGERLSHAVGCAFAVCLERKQKRDKESVSMNFDPKTSTFTRNGSFRQSSLTERMQDPQVAKSADPPPIKQVHNPFAVERPHATPNLLQRQGSLRGGALNTSPFKRQLSLRVNDLPSNQERQRARSVDLSTNSKPNGGSTTVAPIPEVSPSEPTDSISAMCQELSKGLTILSNNDDPFLSAETVASPPQTTPIMSNNSADKWSPLKQITNNSFAEQWINESSKATNSNDMTINTTNKITTASTTTSMTNTNISKAIPIAAPRHNSPNLSQLRSQSLGSADAFVESKSSNPINWNNNQMTNIWRNGNSYQTNSSQQTKQSNPDPFDAEWAALAQRHQSTHQRNTNPFTQSTAPVKAFEVQM